MSEKVPWGELDSGIRPVVEMMTRHGYVTTESCEGHGEDHGRPGAGGVPWVSVDGMEATAAVLADDLRSWGLHGCTVSVCRHVNLSGVSTPFIHVEWWSREVLSEALSPPVQPTKGDPE